MNRIPLPDTRPAITHKVKIFAEQGEMNVYFIASIVDGRIVEVFITAGKIGSTVRGLLNDLARVVSYALQYDVPAQDLFERMCGANYPPQGSTSSPEITACASITDYMFRWLLSIIPAEEGGESSGS